MVDFFLFLILIEFVKLQNFKRERVDEAKNQRKENEHYHFKKGQIPNE